MTVTHSKIDGSMARCVETKFDIEIVRKVDIMQQSPGESKILGASMKPSEVSGLRNARLPRLCLEIISNQKKRGLALTVKVSLRLQLLILGPWVLRLERSLDHEATVQ